MTIEIAVLPATAHKCPTCGEPAFYHAQCIKCRPENLCDYCDELAIPGDPDHACPACRERIDSDHEAEETARKEQRLTHLLASRPTAADFSLVLGLLANYRIILAGALKRENDLTDSGRARYLSDIAEAEEAARRFTAWRDEQ